MAVSLTFASLTNATGEVPAGGESSAAAEAKFRFGTEVGGRFIDIGHAPHEAPDREHVAEKDFEAAIARLISVTFEHPGTEAAERAECALDAAEAALKKRGGAAKTADQEFFSFGGVTVHR